MKNIVLAALCITAFAPLYSQTLFTYGNKAVTKNEFIKAFDRNPSADTTSRKESLKNYLDLYIKYKLKVQAAYDEKLNQTDEYKSEANNFKNEMAETAINNEANMNSLVREAFTRSRKDIQLAQIFIPVAAGSDTATAFAKINEAYSQLKNGKSFSDVVTQFAQDKISKQNDGNIGWITVFSLPYEAENIIYNLKSGDYAKPYHSRIGYHIFKYVKERPAVGKRKIEYILFATSPNASDDEKKTIQAQADSVYNLIQKGASFADMQAQFSVKKSNHNTTEVSVGQYSPDFENEIFALEKEGDISKPFVTAYGYNIVKLIQKETATPDTSDITVKAEMQQKISSDDRLAVAKQNLQNKWLIATGYKPAVYNKQELWQFTDTALIGGNTSHFKTINNNTVLASFPKKKIMVSDWMQFVQMKIQEGNTKPDYKQLLPQFISYITTNYYKQNIEDFHPELKPQIDEFNDANLLFAAMDKHVWSKASQDTVGLLQYYTMHKEKYNWAPGANAIVVSANNKQVADELAAKIKESPVKWRDLTDSYGSLAQADSSRFEQDQLPVKNVDAIKANYLSEPAAANDGNNFTFVYITKVHTQTEPRSFDDARGIVINDYQQVVEDKWLADLKKKYPVKVNESVFNNIQ